MVEGFWQTLFLCLFGGVIGEAIRILGAFREGKPPSKKSDWLVSAVYALLGAGAVLYGWDTKRPAIELATLGAAFPVIFAAGVRAAVPPARKPAKKRAAKKAAPLKKAAPAGAEPSSSSPAGRNALDYMAGRF